MSILKILIVDDEPGIRSGARRILSNFKVDYPFMDEPIEFEILEAATGEEAMIIVEENTPDIVLLDNKLPGALGIEVLEFIRKKQLDIVVVMITSYASLELAVKATREGAYDFIPKPFTPQELRSSIENITKHIFLKRTTQKLNTAGKQIRFQFLSILSHELKTPLNAIEGYLNIIKERQLGDDIKNYEQAIERSIERVKGMRGLILDMLDFTKIESGKSTDKIEFIDIIPILQISLDTIKPFAIQKDVNVYLNTKDSVYIDFDKSQLEIIFNNLLSNAVKYNVENGRVDIWIKKIGDNIEITFSDTGIGMEESDIEKLFVDFFRIKNHQTKNITGSGLGLSITKKIIDLYKGHIQVSSILKKGSNFVLTFPIKQS